jgi:hypothetical protein
VYCYYYSISTTHLARPLFYSRAETPSSDAVSDFDDAADTLRHREEETSRIREKKENTTMKEEEKKERKKVEQSQ